MKRIFTLSLLMLFLKVAFAQITVTIKVVDAYSWSPFSGATVTLPGAHSPTSVVSDASGNAVFTVDTPAAADYQSFTVTAPGYLDYSSNWLWIDPESSTASSTAAIQKAYTINFKVTDQSDVNIENASVTVQTDPKTTLATNAAGEVSFEGLYSSGYHTYVVSALGYADSTATFNFSGNAANPVVVPTIKLNKAYNVLFTVTDGSNAISGVTVTIGGMEVTTDENGQATFSKKINGTYSYLATKSGYIDKNGTVTVSGADISPVVTLNSGFDLTFQIINGASGEVGLQKDTITINGYSKITDETGLLTFGVEAGSNFSFTNKKAGFTSVPVNIENLQENTTLTIYMIPDYKVTFNVYNGIDYSMMEGATVTFNGTEIVTDASGIVTYTNVAPDETPYNYSVTGPEGSGFTIQTGAVSLPLSSTDYLYNNNHYSQSIYLSKPYAYIALTDGWMGYFGAATITFNGVDYSYDAGLGGNTFFVDPGTYSYTVTPENASKAIVSGTVTVTETDPGVAFVNMVAGKKIEMYVTDGSDDPQGIEGASVTLDNETKITDADGYVLFDRKAVNTDYPYAVVKEGLPTVEGTANLVTADLLLNVKMSEAYNVTFKVINGPSGEVALAGDTVTIGDKTLITGADGIVTFQINKGTDISFVNKKTGFADFPVEITNVTSDKTFTIYMTPVYTVAIHVFDVNTYNPLSEVSVVFNGSESSSNVDGYAYFYNVSPSETVYTYSVTGPGTYSSATGEVSLPFTSTEDLLATDNTANVTVTLSSPGVFISLVNGFMRYFGGATVTFDGVNYPYDAGLGAATINCSLGTHTYVIIPDNASKAIITGTVNVETNEVMYLPINVVPGRKVEIYIVDASSNPVVGATVTFNNDQVTTDDTGLAAFNRLPAGSYSYSVTKEGFNSIEETTLDVAAEDILKVLTLTEGYTVTFNVKNKNVAVAGVAVTCDGETVTTDESGTAVFSGKLAGTYSYSLNKSGYDVLSGSVTVTDANLTENVDIVVTGISGVTDNQIKLYPNPTQGLLYVTLPQGIESSDMKVTVTNIAGSVVRVNQTDNFSQQIKLDISNFSNGVYFVKIWGKVFEKTIKVVKN